MSNEIAPTAARLQHDVTAAETSVDDTLITISTLMSSVVAARRDTSGVPVVKGHATIRRLATAQLALVDPSGDIHRVHGDLVEIGRETAGYDLHQECPKASASNVVPLTAAA